MGNLVIVESPAKAGTIQKFLGKDFVVKSSYGHIRDLQDNKLSVEVDNNFNAVYVVPSDKKKVVAELTKAAKEADMVWLASDEDREGEAISWHLSEVLKLDKNKTKRIVFHEITKTAIQNAIQNPREIDINLVNAQQARRVLDRLVGFELSPLLWRKIQKGLSAGRVQSVALRLIVDREKEIMAFTPSAFYKISGLFSTHGCEVKGTLDTKFSTKEEAKKFLEDSVGATYSVASIDKKEASRYPAAPFTTSTLQQEAVRKLHFSVSNTMRVAQSLYERGLITYMRTDSTNLSSLAINSAKQFIVDNYGENYSHVRQYKTHSKGAQEAHEAIRPTYMTNVEIEGTAMEQKLYKLIWKRTIASQMAEAKVLNTNIKLASDKRSEQFSIQASQVLFDGFLKLYIESRDDENEEEGQDAILPEIKIGERFIDLLINAECKFTSAPFRYSEATLVKKLEELGIGRPSTYSPTITTLTTGRGYIVKGDKIGKETTVINYSLKNGKLSEKSVNEIIGGEKGKLLPQEIGMVVADYLVENFPRIMDYDFTAEVEKDFDKIAEGNKIWNDVIKAFYGGFHTKVDEVLSNGAYSKIEREIGSDDAGNQYIAKLGQYGPYIQKGEGEKKQYASLPKGMLIETISLQEAISLFNLPRVVGTHNDIELIVNNGRFGPYLKYGDKNISLPKGSDPYTISLDQCIELTNAKTSILEFKDSDIVVLKGLYGPYIKHAGKNYKLPKGTIAQNLSEEECKQIIESQAQNESKSSRTSKKRK